MTTNHSRSRKMSARTLLIVLATAAPFAWGGLLLFTRYVPPQGLATFLLFFTLLGLALICTLAPLTYLVTRAIPARRSNHPTLLQALRQSTLISAWIIFNLLLRVLHSWSVFTAGVSFGIIVVVELLLLGWR